MSMKHKMAACVIAAAVAIAMGRPVVGQAQGQRGAAPAAQQPQAPPQRVQVAVTEVKPDMIGAYDELIKNDANPALKKGGMPWRWTWTTVSGTGFTRISVQPLTNYAEMDQPGVLGRTMGPGPAATYFAMLRSMVVTTHNYIQTLNPALSIQSHANTPPTLAVLQTFQVMQGKNADFNTSLTSDFLPAYKKAGVKDFWVYNTNYGGTGEIVTIRLIAKFADLDQPGLFNQAGLSAEALQQVFARRAASLSNVSTDLIRFLPDLSYGMPAMSPTP